MKSQIQTSFPVITLCPSCPKTKEDFRRCAKQGKFCLSWHRRMNPVEKTKMDKVIRSIVSEVEKQ